MLTLTNDVASTCAQDIGLFVHEDRTESVVGRRKFSGLRLTTAERPK